MGIYVWKIFQVEINSCLLKSSVCFSWQQIKEDINVLSGVCFDLNCAYFSFPSEKHKAFVSVE